MPSDTLISVPHHPMPSSPGRLVVLASGRGTNFSSILDAIDEGSLRAEVAGLVFNRPDAGCKEVADARDVPSTLVDHTAFDSREKFDTAVGDAIEAWSPDLIVMAGWMRIATERLVNRFYDRIVNIHPSLLPSFKGMNAVRQALDSGATIAGCTVHVVRLSVDAGPIIGQAAVPVRRDDDEAALHERIQAAEHDLYPAAIQAYLAELQ